MKTTILFLLIVFHVAFNTCKAQTLSNRQSFQILNKGLTFSQLVKHKKTGTASAGKTSNMVYMIKTKNQSGVDLFAQLMNWDCKIKVKLNNNFNFILSYN